MKRAWACLVAASGIFSASPVLAQTQPARKAVETGMRRATQFMIDKVAYRGGYLWNYLPDFSRRWGEMEARETMIWLQPPGTGFALTFRALHAACLHSDTETLLAPAQSPRV